jgi:hypothetical protein
MYKIYMLLLKVINLTVFEKKSNKIPTGTNAIPIMKNVGRTLLAVKTGCQLGNLIN